MAIEADIVTDLDAALLRLTEAVRSALPERRRALREVLACLFELREFRKGDETPEGEAYFARARALPEGQIAEGVIFLRGKAVHELARDVAPKGTPLYPGPNTFPGISTFPGDFVWVPRSGMSNPPSIRGKGDEHGAAAYDASVAGNSVLRTLRAARHFLVSDLGPTT